MREVKWNFALALQHMDVGQSFYVPCNDVGLMRRRAWKSAEDVGVVIAVRHVDENDTTGIRVWRTK